MISARPDLPQQVPESGQTSPTLNVESAEKIKEEHEVGSYRMIQSLKTMVVALSQKLKAQEVMDQHMDLLRARIEESEQSKDDFKVQLEDLVEKSVTQVQSNRDSVAHLVQENKQSQEELAGCYADIRALKTALQMTQKQITEQQEALAVAKAETSQLKESNQALREEVMSV